MIDSNGVMISGYNDVNPYPHTTKQWSYVAREGELNRSVAFAYNSDTNSFYVFVSDLFYIDRDANDEYALKIDK